MQAYGDFAEVTGSRRTLMEASGRNYITEIWKFPLNPWNFSLLLSMEAPTTSMEGSINLHDFFFFYEENNTKIREKNKKQKNLRKFFLKTRRRSVTNYEI